MEIKNSNTLLNILLPNDNKIIKDALQQADLSQLTSNNKNISVEEIVLNLFKDISNGTKSNETILNILKNSNAFSEIKNFPKDLQTLSNLLKNNPTLQNFQTKIENFMLNITNINENNLKAQIDNSGIFLESKIGSSLKLLPNNFLDTLIQIKQNIQNFPSLQNTNTLNLVDSILNNNSNANKLLNDIKTLLIDLNSLINAKNISTTLESNTLKLQTIFKDVKITLQELVSTKQPNILEQKVTNDMKAILLQLQQEIISNQSNKQDAQEIIKTLDRLLTQIDYHQLVSITSNSNSLYFPFLWDLLDDGSLQISKENNDKFYCQINLSLKENGKLDLLVAMHKNEIEITMYAQKNSFKDLIKQNIPQLRQVLSSIGLTSINIQIYDLKQDNALNEKKEQILFYNNELKELNFGIDIRV